MSKLPTEILEKVRKYLPYDKEDVYVVDNRKARPPWLQYDEHKGLHGYLKSSASIDRDRFRDLKGLKPNRKTTVSHADSQTHGWVDVPFGNGFVTMPDRMDEQPLNRNLRSIVPNVKPKPDLFKDFTDYHIRQPKKDSGTQTE